MKHENEIKEAFSEKGPDGSEIDTSHMDCKLSLLPSTTVHEKNKEKSWETVFNSYLSQVMTETSLEISDDLRDAVVDDVPLSDKISELVINNPIPRRVNVFSSITRQLKGDSVSPPLQLPHRQSSPHLTMAFSTNGRKRTPTLASSPDKDMITSDQITFEMTMRKSFTEIHNSLQCASDSASAFLGEEVSGHGIVGSFAEYSRRYLRIHGPSMHLSTSYESDMHIQHALSIAPCLLRMPLLSPIEDMDSIAPYAWITPYIVSRTATKYLPNLSRMSPQLCSCQDKHFRPFTTDSSRPFVPPPYFSQQMSTRISTPATLPKSLSLQDIASAGERLKQINPSAPLLQPGLRVLNPVGSYDAEGPSTSMSQSLWSNETLPQSLFMRDSWMSLGLLWVSKDPTWRPWEKRLILICDNFLFECLPNASKIVGYAPLAGSSVVRADCFFPRLYPLQQVRARAASSPSTSAAASTPTTTVGICGNDEREGEEEYVVDAHGKTNDATGRHDTKQSSEDYDLISLSESSLASLSEGDSVESQERAASGEWTLSDDAPVDSIDAFPGVGTPVCSPFPARPVAASKSRNIPRAFRDSVGANRSSAWSGPTTAAVEPLQCNSLALKISCYSTSRATNGIGLHTFWLHPAGGVRTEAEARDEVSVRELARLDEILTRGCELRVEDKYVFAEKDMEATLLGRGRFSEVHHAKRKPGYESTNADRCSLLPLRRLNTDSHESKNRDSGGHVEEKPYLGTMSCPHVDANWFRLSNHLSQFFNVDDGGPSRVAVSRNTGSGEDTVGSGSIGSHAAPQRAAGTGEFAISKPGESSPSKDGVDLGEGSLDGSNGTWYEAPPSPLDDFGMFGDLDLDTGTNSSSLTCSREISPESSRHNRSAGAVSVSVGGSEIFDFATKESSQPQQLPEQQQDCALKLVSKEIFWHRVQTGKERADALIREVLTQVLVSQAAMQKISTAAEAAAQKEFSLNERAPSERPPSSRPHESKSVPSSSHQHGGPEPGGFLDSAHVPVVRILGMFESADGFALELELMQPVDLFEKVSRDGVFSEVQAQQVILQLVEAVALCHSVGVAHRDIKLSNITSPALKLSTSCTPQSPQSSFTAPVEELMAHGSGGSDGLQFCAQSGTKNLPVSLEDDLPSSTDAHNFSAGSNFAPYDNYGNFDSFGSMFMQSSPTEHQGGETIIKLADFGMAGFINDNGLLRGRCGTPGFVAPDILRAGVQEGYHFNVDMFSVGVVAYILLCGYEPFYGKDDAELVKANREASFVFHMPEWNSVSDTAKDFIVKVLDVDARSRLSPDQALAHPWLAGFRTGSRKSSPVLEGGCGFTREAALG